MELSLENISKLNHLFQSEIAFREKFTSLSEQLKELLNLAEVHNKECCDFWDENFPNTTEIVVTLNDVVYKLDEPKREEANYESYLPYGIEFKEIPHVDISTDINQNNVPKTFEIGESVCYIFRPSRGYEIGELAIHNRFPYGIIKDIEWDQIEKCWIYTMITENDILYTGDETYFMNLTDICTFE